MQVVIGIASTKIMHKEVNASRADVIARIPNGM